MILRFLNRIVGAYKHWGPNFMTLLKVLGVVISLIGGMIGIYSFFLREYVAPKDTLREQIKGQIVMFQADLYKLTAYCAKTKDWTEKQKKSQSYYSTIDAYKSKLGKEAVNLAVASKSVYQHFHLDAHDLIYCKTYTVWQWTEEADPCQANYVSSKDANTWWEEIQEKLLQPIDRKNPNRKIPHAEWDKNLECHSKVEGRAEKNNSP